MKLKCLAILAAALFCPAAWGAGDLDRPVKASTNPGLGGKIRAGCAFPVVVQLEAMQDPMQVALTVEARSGSESVPLYTLPKEIVPGTIYRCFIYPHCNSPTDAFTLFVRDAKGRLYQRETLTMRAAEDGSYLVCVLAATRGIPGLVYREPSEKGPGVDVALLASEYMPTKACGYDVADSLVWIQPDPSVLAWPSQEKALRDWVLGGGRLVIATGASWEGAAKSFLAELLPGRLTGAAEMSQVAELERIGGAQMDSEAPFVVSVLEDAAGEILLQAGGRPLVVRRRIGFGEVVFVAFDPTKSPFAKWQGCEAFWNWLFGLKWPSQREAAGGSSEDVTWRRGYYEPPTVSAGISRALNDFPKVRPISFTFVVLFLLVYVIVIGPVDYIVLKRLKHLEWTWFTFPAVALAATLVAFWAISSSRTVQVYINQISVEDWSADDLCYRNRSFATLLSPKNRNYTVSYRTAGANLNLLEGGRGHYRGPGLAISTPFEMRDTPDSGVTAQELFVPVWSSRTFAAQWSSGDPPTPPLTTQITLEGDRLNGSITNYSLVPIWDVRVIHKSGVLSVGKIDPGETREIAGTQRRPFAAFCSGAEKDTGGVQASRDAAKQYCLHATVLFDGTYFPGEFYKHLREDSDSGRRRDNLRLDLPGGFGMRGLLEDGEAVVVGYANEVTQPLEVGERFPERWNGTLYRVCVRVD